MIKINIDLYQESLLLKLFIYIKYYIFTRVFHICGIWCNSKIKVSFDIKYMLMLILFAFKDNK